MMVETITVGKARMFAVQGFVGLLVVMLLSLITFNIVGTPVTFLFIPLIVIFLWPKNADLLFSYILIFLAGLIFDFVSADTPGAWALVFLIGFAMMRPNQRGQESRLAETWVNFSVWMLVLAFIYLVLDFLGVRETDWIPFVYSLTLTVLVFPLLYYARRIVRTLIVSDDD